MHEVISAGLLFIMQHSNYIDRIRALINRKPRNKCTHGFGTDHALSHKRIQFLGLSHLQTPECAQCTDFRNSLSGGSNMCQVGRCNTNRRL